MNISVKSYVEYRERIDLEIARRLGLKDLNNEIEKFISSNCQKVEKDIGLWPLSGKKFKGPDYVKNILNHIDFDMISSLFSSFNLIES